MSHDDQHYYVLEIDDDFHHPLLAWGHTDFTPFLKPKMVDESQFNLPLKTVFDSPVPEPYRLVDLLMLGLGFAASQKIINLFNQLAPYGLQNIPIEIKDHHGQIISGYSYLHIWNNLPAVDKNNYRGSQVNRFGNIIFLEQFSLDKNVLNSVPLEKRLIFKLTENNAMTLVHQSVYQQLTEAKISGVQFYRVDQWQSDIAFGEDEFY